MYKNTDTIYSDKLMDVGISNASLIEYGDTLSKKIKKIKIRLYWIKKGEFVTKYDLDEIEVSIN